jgi:CRP-like cAMP-binding protein
LKNFINILENCPLFDNIGSEDLSRMLSCLEARVVQFDKKNTVISQGSRAEYIGIVLSGSVQTVSMDYNGNRSIISVSEPCDLFGEAFACAELPALPVSVIANEPTEVMLIDCEHILHTCAGHCSYHQQLIFNLMKDLATKTILFHQKIEITSKRTTRDKLLTYLMFQSKKFDSNSFNIPFDRQELADFLEVDRSGLSSEISKLKKEGIIDSRKNYFELL